MCAHRKERITHWPDILVEIIQWETTLSKPVACKTHSALITSNITILGICSEIRPAAIPREVGSRLWRMRFGVTFRSVSTQEVVVQTLVTHCSPSYTIAQRQISSLMIIIIQRKHYSSDANKQKNICRSIKLQLLFFLAMQCN